MKRWLIAAIGPCVLCGPAHAADYAPLNCGRAKSAAEITICRSYALGQAEARMATLYAIATSLVAMGQRGDIGDAQIEFLKARNACGRNVACLRRLYATRIDQLNKVIAVIASRGPY
jgi:uncharacterized protein